MGFENHYEGIDEYAVQLIKYKARQLVGRVGFTESDRDDLEQELMLDLLRRLPKYNVSGQETTSFRLASLGGKTVHSPACGF